MNRSRIALILLIYIAFVALGLPDGLMGVAWPSLRASFGRPIHSLGLLLAASTAGYLTSAFASGRLIARLGVGRTLAASCAATGAGLLGYTVAPAWWMMIPLAMLAGLGAGAIDAGLNTYVAAHFGEGLMQWLHASYGIGVTLGPIIMTVAINAFGSWRVGYATVGAAQGALAAGFLLTLFIWRRQDDPPEVERAPRLTDYRTSLPETLRQGAVWLSLLTFFLYTGAEVTLGSWAYSLLVESRGVAGEVAGATTAGYWASFTVGRVIAGLYARRLGVDRLVRGGLLAALAGALLLWWNPAPWVGLVAVVLVGLAIAPIFPGLVSGTAGRVGPRHAANTIGMQVSAAGLGASLVPGFAGVVARYTSLEAVPVLLAAGFAALLALYTLSTRRPAA